ncbi:MAG: helix-turn-helix transcriptional regulator, partial [Chloroflexota bacterium]
AERVVPVLETIRERARHPLAESAWLHTRGLIEQSVELCSEAAALLEPLRRPLELAMTWESAARVAAALGRHSDALDLAARAETVYLELRAEHDLGRIRQLLRGAGRRPSGRGPRARATSGWESLTPSESEVARLVAGGLSNREAAERLFISRRTVETHLKHVYTKLRLTSRVQLAAAAATRGNT